MIVADMPEAERPKYGGPQPRNYDRRVTADHRNVQISVESGDDVPASLEGQQYPFEPMSIHIEYQRAHQEPAIWEPTSYHYVPPVWKCTRMVVSGANLRKDGTHGEKPQSIHYPTSSHYETGEFYTEADVTVEEGHYLHNRQRARIGEPKTELRRDPLPQWLAAIADRVSPLTGPPFAHGDEHRFGTFLIEQAEVSA
jgi:hypothetical protein